MYPLSLIGPEVRIEAQDWIWAIRGLLCLQPGNRKGLLSSTMSIAKCPKKIKRVEKERGTSAAPKSDLLL